MRDSVPASQLLETQQGQAATCGWCPVLSSLVVLWATLVLCVPQNYRPSGTPDAAYKGQSPPGSF